MPVPPGRTRTLREPRYYAATTPLLRRYSYAAATTPLLRRYYAVTGCGAPRAAGPHPRPEDGNQSVATSRQGGSVFFKNRFARSLAIKVIGLSRCIGLSKRTGPAWVCFGKSFDPQAGMPLLPGAAARCTPGRLLRSAGEESGEGSKSRFQ